MAEKELSEALKSEIITSIKNKVSFADIYNTVHSKKLWEGTEQELESLINESMSYKSDRADWRPYEANIEQENMQISIDTGNLEKQKKDPKQKEKARTKEKVTEDHYSMIKYLLDNISSQLDNQTQSIIENTKAIQKISEKIDNIQKNNPYKSMIKQTDEFFNIYISKKAKKSLYINNMILEQVKQQLKPQFSQQKKENPNDSEVINVALLSTLLKSHHQTPQDTKDKK